MVNVIYEFVQGYVSGALIEFLVRTCTRIGHTFLRAFLGHPPRPLDSQPPKPLVDLYLVYYDRTKTLTQMTDLEHMSMVRLTGVTLTNITSMLACTLAFLSVD